MKANRLSTQTSSFFRRHWYLMRGCLLALVFVAGVIGWKKTDPSMNVIDAAYRSLGLFLMASGADSNPAPLLNFTRFAAPILAAYTILALIFRVLSSQRVLTRALRLRNYTLVMGEGRLALEVISRFNQPGAPVLFLGTEAEEELVPLRKAGIVHLDAVDDSILKRLLAKAEGVIVTAETDLATAEKAKRLRSVRGDSTVPVNVLFADTNLATTWLRQPFEKVISIPPHLATTLLHEVPPLPEGAVAPPPVVIGEGSIASALVRRIVTAWQQPGERIELHAAGTDRAWADAAVAGLESRVDLRWHQMQKVPVFAVRLLGEISDSWSTPARPDRYDIVGSRVYISYSDDAESAPLALAISQSLPNVRVVALVDDASLWYSVPGTDQVIYRTTRELIADPSALHRSSEDDVKAEILDDAAKWPLHGSSPLDVLTQLARTTFDVPDLLADHIAQIFADAGLTINWSAHIERSAFVASPTELEVLAESIQTRLGLSGKESTPDARLASLVLASRLATIVARVGGQVLSASRTATPFGALEIERLAQAAHAAYLAIAQASGNATGSANAQISWNDLPEFERRSNIAQVVDIPLKLARIGMTMRLVEEPREYIFSDDELELLAEHEHQRWEYFQIRNGRQGHIFNIPWSKLDEEIKEYDRAAVRTIPAELATLGIELHPIHKDTPVHGTWIRRESRDLHPDGDLFSRSGRAWAWQLEKEAQWETPRGDILTGLPGDWWVVSDDGASRTVKPDAFRETYELIGGQEFRRVGRIRARQVTVTEIIDTDEGSATALAGDWVASSPEGKRWPIPAEHFAGLYTPDEARSI